MDKQANPAPTIELIIWHWEPLAADLSPHEGPNHEFLTLAMAHFASFEHVH